MNIIFCVRSLTNLKAGCGVGYGVRGRGQKEKFPNLLLAAYHPSPEELQVLSCIVL